MKPSKVVFLCLFLVTILFLIPCILGLFLLVKKRESVDKYPRHYIGSDIVSFLDGTATYHSKFGPVEFECFGTCYCSDEDDQRRRISSKTSTTISRTLSYFVVSVTSFVAYDSAKRYFRDRCEQKMEDEMFCQSHETVHSTVEDCVEVEEHPDSRIEKTEGDKEDGFQYGRKYLCRGGCKDKEALAEWVKEKNHKNVDLWYERVKVECRDEKYVTEESVKIHPMDPMSFDEYNSFYADIGHLGVKEEDDDEDDDIDTMDPMEGYETYKEGVPKIRTGEEYQTQARKIFEGYLDKYCGDLEVETKTGRCDGRPESVECKFIGSYSVANHLLDDEYKQNYKHPNSLDETTDDGFYFPNTPKPINSGDDEVSSSGGLPSGKFCDEDFYERLLRKYFGDEKMEGLEVMYEEYKAWMEEIGEENLPEEYRIGGLGKYHNIANLVEWERKGGDRNIFRKERYKDYKNKKNK